MHQTNKNISKKEEGMQVLEAIQRSLKLRAELLLMNWKFFTDIDAFDDCEDFTDQFVPGTKCTIKTLRQATEGAILIGRAGDIQKLEAFTRVLDIFEKSHADDEDMLPILLTLQVVCEAASSSTDYAETLVRRLHAKYGRSFKFRLRSLEFVKKIIGECENEEWEV